ncbi:MAG: TrkA family potassium uptake protein [Magnetococcales bacterium]|nr:TrkA family potassium uptake protein [Magnetococcales bacterium]
MSGTFLVVGLGVFGSYVAKTLSASGAYVLAVDRAKEPVNVIQGVVSKAVCCDATHADRMEVVGAFAVGTAIVALRNHFEATVLITIALRQHGVPRILVRADNEQQAKAIQTVGATEVLLPSRDMALRIAQQLIHPDQTVVQQAPLGTLLHAAQAGRDWSLNAFAHDVF